VLERQSAAGTRLVLVFFAEYWRGCIDFGQLRGAGIAGVMLDTADKQGGPLTRRMQAPALRSFVEAARNAGLLAGLAGSLSEADARRLLPLGPDFLGFRGALCAGSRRGSRIDPQAVNRIRKLPWCGPDVFSPESARTAA